MKKIISLILATMLLCVAMTGCSSKESVSTDGSTSMSKVIGALCLLSTVGRIITGTESLRSKAIYPKKNSE